MVEVHNEIVYDLLAEDLPDAISSNPAQSHPPASPAPAHTAAQASRAPVHAAKPRGVGTRTPTHVGCNPPHGNRSFGQPFKVPTGRPTVPAKRPNPTQLSRPTSRPGFGRSMSPRTAVSGHRTASRSVATRALHTRPMPGTPRPMRPVPNQAARRVSLGAPSPARPGMGSGFRANSGLQIVQG